LEVNKEQTYYKLVGEAISLLNSDSGSAAVLDSLIRRTAEVIGSGVSLVMLDTSKKKLIHTTSWGLPDAYLHKGVLDADKSLGEVINGQVVMVEDIHEDNRVQFPDLAAKAGISSILGVPLRLKDEIVGEIRVYSKEPNKFSDIDTNFISIIAKLLSIVINNQNLLKIEQLTQQSKLDSEPQETLIQQLREVVFAHPSEKEFARLLDFYHIEWIYEPRSFPLNWEADKVTEMFTPDFYLPALELYVEMTTLKQSLVTKKNRKLRRLKELYPEIKITLLYKKDFERLLAKYGFGPLAETRSRSVKRVLFSANDIHTQVRKLSKQISKDYSDCHPVMIGVLKGVFCFMSDIVREMAIPLDVDFMAISYFKDLESSAVRITKDIDIDITGRHVILIEDIVDTGMTLSYVLKHLKLREPASIKVCTLLDKRVRRIADVTLDYVGFEVPDEFLVGYGLDNKEEYRNLPFIGILTDDEKNEVSPKDKG
jgi:bifunctional protein TilS/HprT